MSILGVCVWGGGGGILVEDGAEFSLVCVYKCLYVLRLSNGSQVIDVDGLRMFVKELEGLPCILPRP